MQTRSKTLIERLGFNDADRRITLHDEIQIWVLKNFKMMIRILFPDLELQSGNPIVEIEHAIMDGKFVIGFIDAYCSKYSIGVEIKTQIPVLGDLVRQIRFYSKYRRVSRWVIVSPDSRFSDLIKEQGFYFFRYNGKIDSTTLPLFG